MILKKIDRMHSLFGKCEEYQCKECCHYMREKYRGKYYRKCLVYGDTQSVSSDWTGRYTACGLFNQPWDGDVEIIKLTDVKTANESIKGQISIFDLEGNK